MAYSQGGVIAATDYNGFVGTNPSTTSGQLNAVWATGNGQYGYGQTAVSQSAATSGTVTATQWSTLVNALNNIECHQTGATTSNVALMTAGSTITYLSAISTNLSTVYTNKLNAGSQGTTTTGTVFTAGITATNNTTYGDSTYATRTVTFASADQARYFFNAGGQINLVITGVTNNDATARSADAVTVIGTNLAGVSAFKAITLGGRTGTGGTVNTNTTAFGYYNLTTAYQLTQKITSTSATYTSDYASVYYKSNGVQGANADVGSVISIALNYYSAHTSTTSGLYGSTGDTLNVTVSHRIDIVYPETTYLNNSWGTVTVA
jgi:hypothetical protein